MTGTPDMVAKAGISVADITAGLSAYSGVLTALFTRATTGRAHPVEVSLFDMAFVAVRQEISQEGRLSVVDEQDFVHRSGDNERHATGVELDPADAEPSDAAWQLALRPGPPLLFRFSALTANAHRIHYDAPYVEGVESATRGWSCTAPCWRSSCSNRPAAKPSDAPYGGLVPSAQAGLRR